MAPNPGPFPATPFLTEPRLRGLVFAAALLFLTLAMPRSTGDEIYDIPREGEITKKAFVAPFTFDILKNPSEIEKERREAESRVLPVVGYDYAVNEKVFAGFRRFFREVEVLRDPSAPDSVKKARYDDLKRDLSAGTIAAFVEDGADTGEVLRAVDRIMDRGISPVLFVTDPRHADEVRARFNADYLATQVVRQEWVTLRRDGEDRTVGIRDLPVREEAVEAEKARLRQAFGKNLIGPVYELLYAHVSPNLAYLEDETRARAAEARKGVLPIRGKVVKDLEIVGRNKLVTPEIYRSLWSLKVAQERLLRDRASSAAWPALGRVLLNALLVFALFAYVSAVRRGPLSRFRNTLALYVVLVLQAALITLAHLVLRQWLSGTDFGERVDLNLLYPMTFGPLLVAVLFGFEAAAVFAAITAFLLSSFLGFEFRAPLVHLAASLAVSAGARRLRYRSHYFLAFLFGALAQLTLIAILGLLRPEGPDGFLILRNFGVAATGGLFSLMLAITLLWVFEKTFGLTTNLTLIELSDMNSPVLKRLSMEAPGTYHHSVLVGNLAESAAEQVGANPLLTRVIAYYHDIGKVFKPEYFIENNRTPSDTLHDKVSPRMSAIIIASHVKQGVEMARKYRLPAVLQDAIREHHGTTLISFFYERARELEPGKTLLRDDFCYPGPRPRSRETALLMLADSVEAASRALEDPTASRLRNLVHDIVEGKIRDGQLDHCDLTFIDLERIRESFVAVLTAMFHARIEYPEGVTETRRLERNLVRKTTRMSTVGPA